MSLEATGWAVLNAAWQGVVVAALAWAALAALGSDPRRRYAVCGSGLAVLAVWVALTAWQLAAGVAVGSPPPGDAAAMVSGANATAAAGRWIDTAVGAAGAAAAPVGAGWAAVAALLLARLAGGALLTRRLWLRGTRAASPALKRRAAALARRAGVRRPVSLRLSARAAVPATIGWRRPLILLPVGAAALDPAELDGLLLHELAHVRRGDFAAHLAQSAVEALLWFHPAARWLSGRMRRERELSCDDDVLATGGVDSLPYARALARLAGARPAATGLALAAGGPPLAVRIRRMLGEGDESGPGRGWRGLLLAAALAVAALVPTAHGAALAGSGRALATADAAGTPRMTIEARDPAGPFTVVVEGGAVVAAAFDGVAVPRRRISQSGERVRFLRPDGRVELELELRPDGFSWTPRPAGASPGAAADPSPAAGRG